MNAVLAFGGQSLGLRELLASRYKGYGALCNPLAGIILFFFFKKKIIPSLLLQNVYSISRVTSSQVKTPGVQRTLLVFHSHETYISSCSSGTLLLPQSCTPWITLINSFKQNS